MANVKLVGTSLAEENIWCYLGIFCIPFGTVFLASTESLAQAVTIWGLQGPVTGRREWVVYWQFLQTPLYVLNGRNTQNKHTAHGRKEQSPAPFIPPPGPGPSASILLGGTASAASCASLPGQVTCLPAEKEGRKEHGTMKPLSKAKCFRGLLFIYFSLSLFSNCVTHLLKTFQ